MSLPFPTPTGVFSSHKANCHCGAIRLSFKISPPLESYPVVSCNCSICQRNGHMFVYPERANVTLESGSEDATIGSYSFATGVVAHKFCKNCGSSVFFEFTNREGNDEGKPDLPDVMGINVSGCLCDKTFLVAAR